MLAVSLVLYSCVTDRPIFRLVTPIMQGLVKNYPGKMQFASKEPVEAYVFSEVPSGLQPA